MQHVQFFGSVNKHTKNDTALLTTCLLCILTLCAGHSAMMEPENMSPSTCRMGGEPQFGVQNCPGPCDLRAVQGRWANHGSADNPAAIYSRGQKVTVKYQRNNHGPGGFIKMSIVPVDDIMNLTKYKENAFHYTCWGGNPVVAKPNELETRPHGYSLIGSDGQQHSFQKGYYTIEITIPPVVPDGDYILRMVWYGGIGNGVLGNSPQMPTKYGYFGDYHSCSFVKVEGGGKLESSYIPKFVNDMEQFSEDGCMSANDREGVCVYEPCRVDGEFQKPSEFKDGKSPLELTPGNFNRMSPTGNEPSPISSPSWVMSPEPSPSASPLESSSPSESPSSAMSMTASPSATPSSSESSSMSMTPMPTESMTPMTTKSMTPSSSNLAMISMSAAPSASPSFSPLEGIDMSSPPSSTPSTSTSMSMDAVPTPLESMSQVAVTKSSPSLSPMQPTQPSQSPTEDDRSKKTKIMVLSCYCISYGKRCSHWLAKHTEGQCMHETGYNHQPDRCKKACCAFCNKDSSYGLCKSKRVQRVCKNYW